MKLKGAVFSSLLFLALVFSNCSKPDSTGAQLYKDNCAVCHMDDGKGIGEFPPIANTSYLIENREKLACIIQNGTKGPIEINGRTYDGEMQGIPELSDVEITNILNYIRNNWYKKEAKFTLAEVNEQMEKCE